MNTWLIAATGILLAFIPCGIVCLRGGVMDRLIAFELASVLTVLIVVILAQGTARPSLHDVALALALLSFPASLVFAYFLERWL